MASRTGHRNGLVSELRIRFQRESEASSGGAATSLGKASESWEVSGDPGGAGENFGSIMLFVSDAGSGRPSGLATGIFKL